MRIENERQMPVSQIREGCPVWCFNDDWVRAEYDPDEDHWVIQQKFWTNPKKTIKRWVFIDTVATEADIRPFIEAM